MVEASPAFIPVLPRGMILHPDKPLNFDLLVDSGNDATDPAFIKEQGERMMKYFLAAVTLPGRDLWVNLSPYEHERMISLELGQTQLGRDMLAQDYLLKQLTASLIYPEKDLGREFWSRVYKAAEERFGSTDIPVSTFNKVWIMPDKAEIFEKGNAVYVTHAKLKILSEVDYLARSHHEGGEGSALSVEQESAQQVIRDVVIPAIEQEVNEGRNFAPMRQIYHAAILAKWYRQKIAATLLSKVFVDQKKISGVDINDATLKEQIYERYMAAYKQGVFDYIKEEVSVVSGEAVPHKYFSGGERVSPDDIEFTQAQALVPPEGELTRIDFTMTPQQDPARPYDAEMSAKAWANAKEKFGAIFNYARAQGLDLDAISRKCRGLKVILNEVTFRDGIQGEQEANAEKMTPQQKIDGIQKFIDAGVTRIEAGAYPSPRLLEKGFLPGVKNTPEVADLIGEKKKAWPGVEVGYLVLDRDGDIEAIRHDPDLEEVSYNVAVSIQYSIKNLNLKTGVAEIDEQGKEAIYAHIRQLPEKDQYELLMQGFRKNNVPSIRRMIRHALTRDSHKPLRVRIYPSNAFGYSSNGVPEDVDPSRLVRMMEEMARTIDAELTAIAAELGVADPRSLVRLEFAISDTTGEVTDPSRADSLQRAQAVFTQIRDFKRNSEMPVDLALHLQAKGMGLLTAIMYLDAMADLGEDPVLDVSLGYTGGSPFTANAPGNVGLGDLLVWLKALKIKTRGKDGGDVDISRVLSASRWLQTFFKDDFMSRGAAGFNHMTDAQLETFEKDLQKDMGIKDDAAATGGIDIKDIGLTSAAGGRGMHFDDDAVAAVYKAGFDGFLPVALSVTPVSDPAALFQ